MQSQTSQCSHCRFVACGGNVPWLNKITATSMALLLVEGCCHAGSLDDEAPLYQLLHNCSAALGADVSAVASAQRPAAAAGVTAANDVAASAERARAAPAADQSADPSQAAGGQQRGEAPAEQQPSGQQRAGDSVPRQQPDLRPELPQLEWESHWAKLVARALEVRQHEHIQILTTEVMPMLRTSAESRVRILLPAGLHVKATQSTAWRERSQLGACSVVDRRWQISTPIRGAAAMACGFRRGSRRVRCHLRQCQPTSLASSRCWPMRRPCSEARPLSGAMHSALPHSASAAGHCQCTPWHTAAVTAALCTPCAADDGLAL